MLGKALLVFCMLACRVVAGQVVEADAVFGPGPDCRARIVSEIGKAEHSVRVQAYYFSSPEIAEALLAAKRQGRDVAVIVDEIGDGRQAARLRVAGVPVLVDELGETGIAHNKLAIIDGEVVLTGSFNYDKHAEKNAENVVVIRSKELAGKFEANWQAARARAEKAAKQL